MQDTSLSVEPAAGRRLASVLLTVAAVALALLGYAFLLPVFWLGAVLFLAAITTVLVAPVAGPVMRAVMGMSVLGLVLAAVIALVLTPVRTGPDQPGPTESAPATAVP